MSDDDQKSRKATANALRLNVLSGILLATLMLQALLLLAMPFGPGALVPSGLAILVALPTALAWKSHVRTRNDLPVRTTPTASEMGGAMLGASMARSGSAALSASAANAAAASRTRDSAKLDAAP